MSVPVGLDSWYEFLGGSASLSFGGCELFDYLGCASGLFEILNLLFAYGLVEHVHLEVVGSE